MTRVQKVHTGQQRIYWNADESKKLPRYTYLTLLVNMPAIRGGDSKKKTRRHTRDLDQIHADLHKEKHLAQYKDTKNAEDLPGLGQFYCIECAKWFESEFNLTAHTKGKPHRRR